MKVKELIKILKTLNQNAVIDMASDEEGNSFGDISKGDYSIAEGKLKKTKEQVYSLYPENNELTEERYI